MSIKSTLLALLFLSGMLLPASAQFCPVNIDFETGTTSNWEYFKGTVAIGPVYSMTPCPPTVKRHTLTSGVDTDYYGGFPVVAPGGKYSMKIGNNATGGECERIRYYVHVPIGGVYSLIYQYAAVMQDVGHSPAEQPRMTVRAFDSSTGVTIPCDSLCFVASKGLYDFKRSPYSTRGDTIRYRPWTSASMNFQGLGGHVICIEFTVNDCTALGHFGYGYVDMNCGLFANTVISCSTPTVKLNGTPGYQSYRWCDSTTMGITIDTTQDVTIPSPGVRTTYALILTPYPGYGCTDTLYTAVIPLVPYIGGIKPAWAYVTRSPFCGDPDILDIAGYSSYCGYTCQWESSPDNSIWTAIPGATSSPWTCSPAYKSLHYRCKITAPVSGSSIYSTSAFVPSLAGVGLSSISIEQNTVCTGLHLYVSACGLSKTYNVTTYYGDGYSDNVPLSVIGIRHVDIRHDYNFPGTYSIKQVLYDGTIPVDSVVVSYNYKYCKILPVKFYFDGNSNCRQDNGETNFFPVKVEIDSNGIVIDTISATSGFYYQAIGGVGTIYQFRLIDYPNTVDLSCPLSGTISDTIRSLVNNYDTKCIGFTCKPGTHNLVEHAVIPVTGVRDQWGNVYVYNTDYCVPIKTATVTLSYSPKYTSVDSRTKAVSSGNTLQWIVNGLTAKPISLYYAIWSKISPLSIGDTVHTHVILDPIKGDSNPSDNEEVILDTVRAGCDPNFIAVSPAGCLASGVEENKLLYTVHFENTGNDTAHNIYIMDTLSGNVDPHTLQIVSASAQMDVALLNVDGLNIVKFDFPGIKLLDSTHKGECDGMVMYSIDTKPGLPKGASIQNHAGIFFDYNEVVLTNTVENIIGCPTLKVTEVARSVAAQIYPNPATDELIIKMTKDAYTSFTITNQIGQVLIEQQTNTSQTKVDIKTLAPGLYYITLRGANGTSVQKFVKL